MFTVIADFLAQCRKRGIANVDVNTIAFGGLEGRYTTEYFRAGVVLIQDGKGEAALEKLYYQTMARADFFYQAGEFYDEIWGLKSILDFLVEEDPREGDVSLGKILDLARYYGGGAYDAIAARFPGVTPVDAW